MEIKGAYLIAATRETVWTALNDPATLQRCLPGCEKLEKQSDTAFSATIKTKIGPVSARFAGRVTLEDLDPPSGYRIVGEGQGGVAGFAKGSATVTLRADGNGTMLSYDADAKIGGKLAQIGSRLVAGTIRKLTDEFFRRFVEAVAPGPTPEKLAAQASNPS